MEVEGSTEPAINRMLEFFAHITLIICGISLAAFFVMTLYWAWRKSSYLRRLCRRPSQHGNNDIEPALSMVSIPAAQLEYDSEGDDTEVGMVIFMKGVTLLLSQDTDRVSNHVPADTEQDCGHEAQPHVSFFLGHPVEIECPTRLMNNTKSQFVFNTS